MLPKSCLSCCSAGHSKIRCMLVCSSSEHNVQVLSEIGRGHDQLQFELICLSLYEFH